MKKVLWTLIILIIISSSAFAQKYRKMGEPMPISLTNPVSFNGTYKIERLIIRDGDNLLLDSDNDYEVYEDKGVATINMKIGKDNLEIDLVYKVQMVGPAFKRPEIAKYTFIYDSRTFSAKRDAGVPLSKSLTSIGMMVYDHEDLIWEMPFEDGRTLILKFEKKSDISTPIDKKPFIYIAK